MYQHFVSKGLMETANSLLREASLDSPAVMKAVTSYQPFHYRSPAPSGVSHKILSFRIYFFYYIASLFYFPAKNWFFARCTC